MANEGAYTQSVRQVDELIKSMKESIEVFQANLKKQQEEMQARLQLQQNQIEKHVDDTRAQLDQLTSMVAQLQKAERSSQSSLPNPKMDAPLKTRTVDDITLHEEVSLMSETDVQMRRAAFQASTSVVSITAITSYAGVEKKHHASGTVIHSEFVDSVFKGRVLTSANLIRDNLGENTIINDLKRALELVAYEKFQKISHGDIVFILGRFHKKPFRTLMSSGKFTIGGPVVNLRGEVLGLAHYDECFIPFLPSNVICKLLDYYKSKGQFCHPWIGMEVLNLCRDYGDWVEVFRGRTRSVVIEKVEKNSPADKAGLCSKDVILQCDGQDVNGVLQFNKMIWDKEGEFKLKVLRSSDCEPMDFILVPECKPEAFNR